MKMTGQQISARFEPEDVIPPLEEAPDGILLTTASGRVRYANRAAAELLCVEVGRLVGQDFGVPLTSTVHPEIEVRETDGSSRVLELRAKPVVVDGDQHWIVTLRDETARVAAVQRLANKLDVMDAALATTSHELRGALSAMSLALDTWKQAGEQLTPDTRTTLIKVLERNLWRMSESIEHFLDAARMGHGLFTPAPAHVKVLDAVLESLPGIGDAADSVDVRVPADCFAHIDPFHLTTIVSNLLGNSVKYGGTPVVVRAHTAHDTATIEVCDTGPGISPAIAERLFEKFVRAAEAERTAGFGLGLWIARSLARAYGGDLTYVDNEPVGARFVCTLPAGDPSCV